MLIVGEAIADKAKMENTKAENTDPNFAIKKATKISDETGVRFEMVNFILYSFPSKSEDPKGISSQNLSKFILQKLIDKTDEPLKELLIHNGINSSADIGRVMDHLCKEGLLQKGKDDDFKDFEGQFETKNLDEYLKKENIKRKRGLYTSISNWMYGIGFIVVIASYVTQIPRNYAKAGWAIGMLGWVLQVYRKPIEKFLKKLRANYT
ncbi:MAG: hypothetical protein AAF696_29435 [Bacteroidota bacterium]